MNLGDMLDAARVAAGVDTDSQLSLALGLSRTAVSNYRRGVSLPDVVTCEKLAVLCGFPPLRVIATINEQRAISSAEKKVWRRLAAAIFVSIVVTLPAYAEAPEPLALCTLCAVAWVTMRVTFRIREIAHRIRRANFVRSSDGYGPAPVLA